MDLGTQGIVSRKRRHRASTDSSIIQFAKPHFLKEEREDERPNNNETADSDSEPNASSDIAASKALTWSDSPPRQPVQKSYDRQPRRKMREQGKTEIEMAKEIARREEKKRSDKSKGVTERKRKKQQQRQRKSKEGEMSRRALDERPSNILHQAFESGHVTKDRLTLKPSLGLFKKGKASLPERGLPDLVFSEMQFLGRQSSRIAAPAGERHHNHTQKADETVSSYFTQKPKKKEKSKPKSPEAGFQRRSKGSKSVVTTASIILDTGKHSTIVDANEREHPQRNIDTYTVNSHEHNRPQNARSLAGLSSAPATARSLPQGQHHDKKNQQGNTHESRYKGSQQASRTGNSHIYMSSDELDSQYVRMRKEHAENVVSHWLENPEEISQPFRYPTSEIQEIENEWTKPIFGDNPRQNPKEQFYIDPICPEPGRLLSPTMPDDPLEAPKQMSCKDAHGGPSNQNPGEQNNGQRHGGISTKGDVIGPRSPQENLLYMAHSRRELDSIAPEVNLRATNDGEPHRIDPLQRSHVFSPGIKQQNFTNVTADLSGNAIAPAHLRYSKQNLPNLPVPSQLINEAKADSQIPRVQPNVLEENSSGLHYGRPFDQNAHTINNPLQRPLSGVTAWEYANEQQQQGSYDIEDDNIRHQMNQPQQSQTWENTVDNAPPVFPTQDGNHFSTPKYTADLQGHRGQNEDSWHDHVLQRPQSARDSGYRLQNYYQSQNQLLDDNHIQRIDHEIRPQWDEQLDLEDNLSPLRMEDSASVYMSPQDPPIEEDPWMLNYPLSASEANFSMERNPAFQLQNSRPPTAPQGNISRRGYRRMEAIEGDVQQGLILPQRRQLFGLRQDTVENLNEGDAAGPKMFWRPRKIY